MAAQKSGFRPVRNVGQCRLDFTAVEGDAAPIPFVFGQGDATMVDLTTPANPKPVEAATYAFTLAANQDGGGSSGGFIARLVVDDDWYSATVYQFGQNNFAHAAVTWYCDALSPFYALIIDFSADTYSGSLYVQRVA